jgi:hypothetical protein
MLAVFNQHATTFLIVALAYNNFEKLMIYTNLEGVLAWGQVTDCSTFLPNFGCTFSQVSCLVKFLSKFGYSPPIFSVFAAPKLPFPR